MCRDQGKLTAAEPLYADAVAMRKRLFKGDHPDVASSLRNPGFFYREQGKPAAAEPFLKDALAMQQRLATDFAVDKTEGEVLTLLARQPLARDAFLSNERARGTTAATVYTEVWAEKGAVARAYERRQMRARAAAADPRAAKLLAELADARRRAELLLARPHRIPPTALAATRNSRSMPSASRPVPVT